MRLFDIDMSDMIANCVTCDWEGTFLEGKNHETDDHPVVYNPKGGLDDVPCGCGGA